MEASLITRVLRETLQDKFSLLDEAILQYMVDVLADVTALTTSSIEEALSPLLLSAGVVDTDEDASVILHSLVDALTLHAVDAVEQEDEEPLKLPSPMRIACDVPKSSASMDKYSIEMAFPAYEEKPDPTILTVAGVIADTYEADPRKRLAALKYMCPCKVKDDIDELWQRIMQMSNDPDSNVRYQVAHDLCDGSPAHMEDAVIRTLESMHNDPDKRIRRTVHRVLTHYGRTGKWNIL